MYAEKTEGNPNHMVSGCHLARPPIPISAFCHSRCLLSDHNVPQLSQYWGLKWEFSVNGLLDRLLGDICTHFFSA